MLGYIRTDAKELRLREHESYRALYCGLCRRMGKCTGQCSRFSLSYDFVFLAALRYSFGREIPEIEKRRCPVHPLRPRPMAKPSEALTYCAHASALLTYHKCRDDCRDERGGRRLRGYLARGFFRPAYRKAKKALPELDLAIRESLSALSDYENTPDAVPSADRPAALFGELMATVFSYGLSPSDARVAAAMGRAVGHWIYLVDAADDLVEDQKKGRFNPLLLLFENSPTSEDLERVKLSLTGQLMRGEQALLLMDSFATPEIKEIIYNIFYLGLPSCAERVLEKAEKQLSQEKRDP
ncbi:MAG: hypothetical protein IJX28_03105 [Clostridia bacterium]|nr:hypothetical protein [Clostridia bacterium]